jgi:hypothetical protein
MRRVVDTALGHADLVQGRVTTAVTVGIQDAAVQGGAMASARSSVRSRAAVMRFPCGHSEPEASLAGRVRRAAGRAVWVACRRCNVIALACAPAGGPGRRVGKSLTAHAH